MREAGANALAQLALNIKNKVDIAEEGGIPPLVAMVGEGNLAAREAAALALSNMATNMANQAGLVKVTPHQLAPYDFSFFLCCYAPDAPSLLPSTTTPSSIYLLLSILHKLSSTCYCRLYIFYLRLLRHSIFSASLLLPSAVYSFPYTIHYPLHSTFVIFYLFPSTSNSLSSTFYEPRYQ